MTAPDQPTDDLSDFAALMTREQEFPSRRDRIDPDVRRARRRRGLLITAVCVVLLLAASGGYIAWALTAPVNPPAVTTRMPPVPVGDAAAIAAVPASASAISISGADAYLGEGASGTWSSSGTGDPLPIASITKLITALVILDAVPLASADDPGPTITFSKADHDLYDRYYVQGATIAPMPTGTAMSLHDALATMLIPSASNYAEALSSRIFGSQNAFLGATRDWLSAHGLTGTTITEPTGISPRNTSTTADLLAIGKLAAANPTIAQIVATPSISLPGAGQLYNTNGLLGTSGITGLKTGTLGHGTYSLLYTATLVVGTADPLAVTGVVLGGPTRESVNDSVIATLSGIRAGFREMPVATSGQEVGTITTPWGSTAQLVIGEDATIFTWSDTPIVATMDIETPPTYRDGSVVGSITWTAGPHTVTAPVEITGSIDPPSEWWRLTHPSELGSTTAD
ncbi:MULTISPECIES: D-alanyl-D-alanine carboxypeptidase family protein [unclassified Microbacterium]|uniref:D-alanyl-D-alanine carboxypeptidase family protein n=1 Tax=unclassified Microbacterium TaxID=2609290 RepID=UPI0016051F6D|nr:MULTISPECIES: D-alanyl-D-alanine carboxypeptidase [unclassified Microbacterium]QNA91562.1 D-alanyl-D-alanine carboxypeptidase [Microbacterium sp. Se63.02b]QYM64737.1 D-alanyl-D-alanine carboxypeptidase [Microbacterium sp. Se5.02b]